MAKTPFSLLILFAVLLGLPNTSFSQNAPATYKVFDKKGKEISFFHSADQMKKADVILFGEMHNNSINHWLQLQLIKYLGDSMKFDLTLGAEMFEADDQIVIDEYFAGKINEKYFEKESKLWNNYETDYKPLLEYAKEHTFKMIATNVPRRYAHMIAHNGVEVLDNLSKEAHAFMAPLPLKADTTVPGYPMLMAMSHGSEMSGENFMYAQAIKDATMAHRINEHLEKDHIFIHFNGDFHSKRFGGIYWYLNEFNKKLDVKVIAVVESDNLKWEESFSELGDYIILLPSDITRTY